jgi:hypothetical protein
MILVHISKIEDQNKIFKYRKNADNDGQSIGNAFDLRNIKIKKSRLLQESQTQDNIEQEVQTETSQNETNNETPNNPDSSNEENTENNSNSDNQVEEEAKPVENHYDENDEQHHIIIKINKRTFLIILSCSISGIVLLGLVICGICFFCTRKKKNETYTNRLTQSSFNDTRDMNRSNIRQSNPYLTQKPNRRALSHNVNTIPKSREVNEVNYRTRDRPPIQYDTESSDSDETDQAHHHSEYTRSKSFDKGRKSSPKNQNDSKDRKFASQQNNRKVTELKHKGILKKVKPKKSKSSKKTGKKKSKSKSKSKKNKKNNLFDDMDANFLKLDN